MYCVYKRNSHNKFIEYVVLVSIIYIYKLSSRLVDCLIAVCYGGFSNSLHQNHQDGKEGGQMTLQKRERKGKWISVVFN